MELLAPCSSLKTFYAALNAKADAVYLGGKNYSARAYAENFTLEEIKQCIDMAHAVNVKVYIVVNTLLFDEEFDDCLSICEEYIKMGVDSFIIQDIGLLEKIHALYPKFPLHASTQLNVSTVEQAKALKAIGVKRVVLARELSIEKIKEIIDKTHLEVEVFVHGALCVSCSGQCLMSSFIGNRSGNKGKCAQPCRLEGKIVSQNFDSGLIYPLSMKDLALINYLDKLKEIGVTSLKIEGRMKSVEYIYHTVKIYREKLDNILNKNALQVLKTTFNRSYTKGFMFHEDKGNILNQKSSSHIGVEIGKVSKVNKNSFFIVLKDNLNLHDGIRDLNIKDGFLLTHFKLKGNDIHYAKKGDYVEIISPIKGIKVNDVIVKTKSKVLEDEANSHLKDLRKVGIGAYFYARENEEMVLNLYEGEISITVSSSIKLTKSNNIFITKDELTKRLNKSDVYPYYLNNITFDIDENLFYPLKDLNELRRNAYSLFHEQKILSFKNRYQKVNVKKVSLKEYAKTNELCSVYNEEQLKCVLNYPFSSIFVNEELYKKYKNLDSRIHLAKYRFGENLVSDEECLVQYYANKGLFVSSYANVTNYHSLYAFLKNNYKGVILSYEISFDDAKKLKNNFENEYKIKPLLYYPIYGHVEYMLLKACPIASSSNKKERCGLCHKEQYYYVDRKNIKYPLISDNRCMIKVLSNEKLSLLRKKEIIKKYFIPYFYFSLEKEDEIKKVLDYYFFDEYFEEEGMDGHFYKSAL